MHDDLTTMWYCADWWNARWSGHHVVLCWLEECTMIWPPFGSVLAGWMHNDLTTVWYCVDWWNARCSDLHVVLLWQVECTVIWVWFQYFSSVWSFYWLLIAPIMNKEEVGLILSQRERERERERERRKAGAFPHLIVAGISYDLWIHYDLFQRFWLQSTSLLLCCSLWEEYGDCCSAFSRRILIWCSDWLKLLDDWQPGALCVRSAATAKKWLIVTGHCNIFKLGTEDRLFQESALRNSNFLTSQ